MNKKFTMYMVIMISVLLFSLFCNKNVYAEEKNKPHIKETFYTRGGYRPDEFVATEEGFMRIVGEDDYIYVENYNDSYELQSLKLIDYEMDFYGGFYDGTDAYYILFGQNNTEEDDNKEVLRLVKYSKTWEKLGYSSIKGGDEEYFGIRIVLEAGDVDIDETDEYIYVATTRRTYILEDGNSHQGFLSFKVNKLTMESKVIDENAAHSLEPKVRVKNSDNIYVAEEFDGLGKVTIKKFNREDSYDFISVFDNIPTGLAFGSLLCLPSVDAIEYSDNNILVMGTSIDADYDYTTSDVAYPLNQNIYLTVTPQDDFSENSTTVKWLARSDAGSINAYMSKISDDRFIILYWDLNADSIAVEDEYDRLSKNVIRYFFIDGDGNKVGEEHSIAATINAKPTIKNDKIVFYASEGHTYAFYEIDTQTGNNNKIVFRNAGEDSTWSYKNGILTIEGTGTTYNNLSYEFEQISQKIDNIILSNGMTAIGDGSFTGLRNLKKIEYGSVTEIGATAFLGCSGLGNVIIPRGIKSIGDNAFSWLGNRNIYLPDSIKYLGNSAVTGYSHTGNPIGTIFCTKDSYAYNYAITNDIPYKEYSINASDQKRTYTGEVIDISKFYSLNFFSEISQLSFTYFTDEKCTIPTSVAESGAIRTGGAPKNVGVYYLKIVVSDNPTFPEIVSNIIKLEIIEKQDTAVNYYDEYSEYDNGNNNDTYKNTSELSESEIKSGTIVYEDKSLSLYKIKSVKTLKGKITGGTVEYLKPLVVSSKKFVIPDKIKIDGIMFDVISIGNKAFYNNRTITNIKISKNIKKIGSKAFYNCKKLKSIEVKSKVIKSVGKNAFKGIGNKATIKVPKKKKKAYTKLFRKNGLPKKVKIK